MNWPQCQGCWASSAFMSSIICQFLLQLLPFLFTGIYMLLKLARTYNAEMYYLRWLTKVLALWRKFWVLSGFTPYFYTMGVNNIIWTQLLIKAVVFKLFGQTNICQTTVVLKDQLLAQEISAFFVLLVLFFFLIVNMVPYTKREPRFGSNCSVGSVQLEDLEFLHIWLMSQFRKIPVYFDLKHYIM